MIDTEIPVRQMLEQIVAKLGIPPFLLGLNWSTTERMSAQQADILTSELESYRRLVEPAILKICNLFLRLRGYTCLLERTGRKPFPVAVNRVIAEQERKDIHLIRFQCPPGKPVDRLELGSRYTCEAGIAWDNINLQDELELANARLTNLQADQLEQQLQKEGTQI